MHMGFLLAQDRMVSTSTTYSVTISNKSIRIRCGVLLKTKVAHRAYTDIYLY